MANNSHRRQSPLICLGLAAVVAAVYWPVHRFQFVSFDDPAYVTANRRVQSGLTGPGLMWALTSRHMGNWHPLTWVSHMTDWQMYGGNAGGHHATNALLHLANTLLLFCVLRQMTGALWRSGLVAALFGLHPLHVESVAWVAERKDVLSTFFWMLALLAYGRYVQTVTPGQWQVSGKENGNPSRALRHSLLSYGLALVFFALGLMSKPMVVTLPFVLLLLDCWPLRRFQLSTLTRLVWEKVPFLALAAVACAVAYWAQQRGGAMVDLETMPVGVRAGNAVVAYARYVGQALWPVGLAVFYPYRLWPPWAVVGGGTMLAGVTALVLWRVRREPWLAVGWFWFVGTLVPVIGLVQVGLQAMADRYVYVPLIGLAIMAVWGLAAVARGLRRSVAIVAATGCLMTCGVLSGIQLRAWKDSETLFRHALAVTTGNFLAHDGLGLALFHQGRVPEAIQQYEQAVQLQPQHAWVRNNLGAALFQLGRVPEAVGQYEHALRLNPELASAHYNLGNALVQLRRVSEAIGHYEQAILLDPDSAEAHFSLGTALLQLGKVREAAGHLEQALRLNPDSADAHNHLGVALVGEARVAEAIAHYERALQLRPDDPDAHFNLGNALVRQGRTPEAARHYEQVLQLRPQYPKARNNLANTLVQQGRVSDAIAQYEQSLVLDPDYADARGNLGFALNALAGTLATETNGAIRNVDEAVRCAERACQLTTNSVPMYLDTLGIAYSEAGRFDDAVQTTEHGVALARATGNQELAAVMESRLDYYRSGRAYHSIPQKTGP